MSRILQLGILTVWLGWLVQLTVSTDVLILREGPDDFSHRGPGYPDYGMACTYFTTLGMTTRFFKMTPGASAPPPACPDRLWPS